MTGANADALDAAATELRHAADQLDATSAKLTRSLGVIQWLGQVAVRFTDLWSTGHRPRIATAATFLRDNADVLVRQAEQQRKASNSDGGTADTGHGFGGAAQRAKTAELELTRLRGIATALAPDLRRARGLSLADQLTWWNSLRGDQRNALMATRPGELTALAGLPADIRQQAQDNYTASIADQILTSKTSVHGEIEGDIKIVRVGAGFDVEERTYKNGRVELDLSAFLKAGIGDGDAKALAKAGVGGVWEFKNMQEANDFINGLKREIVPSAGEVLNAWGNVGAASAVSLLGYLGTQSSHLGSVSASAGIEASVGAGGSSAGAEGGVKVSVDTTRDHAGDVTISAHESVNGQVAGGTLGVSGDANVEASVTLDGTTPKTITISMDYKNAALTGVFGELGEASMGGTHSGSTQITFDLTRPEMAAAANVATAALKHGDVAGATRALSGVMDQAQVSVQDMVGSVSTLKFDAHVVSAEVSTSVSATTSTYVKPPGGSFYEVKQ
jgi:hypothetical protein